MLTLITFLTAIGISAVAAWYSISGLTAIFAAAKLHIAIMGGVLEVGKLVTASWLYQNWDRTPKLLRGYLCAAVLILMFITSMGIFGFLSKAHIDQTLSRDDHSLEMENYDRLIAVEESRISDARQVISELDESIAILQKHSRINGRNGALATREKQRPERDSLNALIDASTQKIIEYSNKRRELQSQQLKMVAEVGPIRYIAQLVYDDVSQSDLEEAVRWVIILIIFVFDPLAVLLLIAFNMSLNRNQYVVRTAVAPDVDWSEVKVEVQEGAAVTAKTEPEKKKTGKDTRYRFGRGYQ